MRETIVVGGQAHVMHHEEEAWAVEETGRLGAKLLVTELAAAG